MTTDFCPWANRFVFWLREPVGWFVLATAASVVVGLYVAPIGWTLAASLASLIAVGMLWPAVAVHAAECSLGPYQQQVHEDEPCELQLAVRNRWPLPIWGLAIEGYLDRRQETVDEANVPTVALAFVRAMATSTYRISIRPEMRGRYPDGNAVLTCSFPFGIWTAKRKLKDVSPITVWPRVYPIAGQAAIAGSRAAESGEGQRRGRTGDFLGVREYRRGDSVRQVNWIATARSGDLVVTERSGPQCPTVLVIVDTAIDAANPDELADRVRVAASLLANLHQSSVPLRVHAGSPCLAVRRGREGFIQIMDRLADIPADGFAHSQLPDSLKATASLLISSNGRGEVLVCISDPSVNPRSTDRRAHRVICRNRDLSAQLLSFWGEVCDENLVA
ncbi:DUF58 domain-containing protein [Roseiconus nitratireducens]|uniref:DUF58 domain-containing protein n=1 Tax=Roseiconus nitratireducens TaxID=2605748 RepID=A0A5M6DFH1_9BACT|nr:DUF58 domain-containing protein [Roseiconus nitratireducens]